MIGVFYILFVLKEVKREKKEEIEMSPGVDNPGFDNAERHLHLRETQNANGNRELTLTMADPPKNQPNCLLDFFNPVVALECIKVLMRKRENQGRATVILLFVMYFIAVGPAFGEEPNEYNFTRIALNWDGITYSTYATYGNATSLIGTIIMVIILGKLFKISDPFMGVIGTSLSCVSRIFYVSFRIIFFYKNKKLCENFNFFANFFANFFLSSICCHRFFHNFFFIPIITDTRHNYFNDVHS